MTDDDDFPPPLLVDMRLVYGDYEPEGGWGPRHKGHRKELEESPTKFMDRLAGLERDWMSREESRYKARAKEAEARAAAVSEVPSGPCPACAAREAEGRDPGTARCLEMAEELLKKHGKRPE